MRVIATDGAARDLPRRREPDRTRWRSTSWSRSASATCVLVHAGGDRRSPREVRRRVPGRRAGPGARGRDPGRGRPRAPLQGDGGLRRAHALDLQVRDRRPAARQRRARARTGLSGLRDPDGSRRRRDRGRPQRRRDLHLLRRHAARPRLGVHAARRQGEGRRHPDGLLAARRAADRAREPGPRGRVLRDRLRDHRPVDRADAEARQGRGDHELLRACATTSRSCRRCARCSSRPTCGSTASSAPATSARSSARGRLASSQPTMAARS